MRRIYIATLLLTIGVSLTTNSKSFGQSVNLADSVKSMLVKDWERAKAYTQDYMNAMPANQYSYRATDSVRTFAQQLLHLAQANMFFVSTATGGKAPYAGSDLEKSVSAQSADSVQYYVNASYDFAINEIKKISPATLVQTATLNMGRPFTTTRLSWLMKGFEHQTHHRGQATIYLRLAGVRPPGERLF